MEISKKNNKFVPLLTALEQITYRLELHRSCQVIVATLEVDKLLQQSLPTHCSVTKRSIHGQRITVQGRRKTTAVAHWPKDGLVESELAELIFVLSGEGDLRFSDYVMHCRAGDILFVPARLPKFDGARPVYETVESGAHCTLLFIRFGTSLFQNVSVSISYSSGKQHTTAKRGEASWHNDPYLGQLYIILSDRLQNGRRGKSTFYLLRALVALIREEIEGGMAFDSTTFPSDSLLTLHEDAIHQAIRYIRNHINRPLTIEQLARWVGLSRSAFTSRFRRETGKTFKEFHNEIRLERAKVLLQQTDLPIERVSERVGITPGQLRQLFHQKLRCSPREFRRS